MVQTILLFKQEQVLSAMLVGLIPILSGDPSEMYCFLFQAIRIGFQCQTIQWPAQQVFPMAAWMFPTNHGFGSRAT